MLLIELKPVKQVRKPYVGYTTYKNTPAANTELKSTAGVIMLEHAEYTRRQAIINKLYRECPYNFAKTLVRPVNDDAYAKEGLYQIEKVCSTWTEFKGPGVKDERTVHWPESDNPMIVYARCLKTNKSITCTVNYMCLPVDKAGK